MSARNAISAATIALLLSPFLILAARGLAGGGGSLDVGETIGVLGFTFFQAFASALTSIVLGIAGGMGLIWANTRFNERQSRVLEAFALLPNAVPVLLVLLASLKLFPTVRGFAGIVVVHALLNIGLVAVSFAQLARAKIAGMAELAWVEGSGRAAFLLRGALPYLRPDLVRLFLFVFALCFSSFAVPLVMGGSRATTIEVLIYQKIRVLGDWNAALILAAIQVAAVLTLSVFLRRETAAGLASRLSRSPLLAWRWGLGAATVPGIIVVAGSMKGFFSGWEGLSRLDALMSELPQLFLGSLAVGSLTGFLVIAWLALLAYAEPKGSVRRFLLGFAAPSSVLVGFAILIAWRATGWATFVKIAIGLSMITVPSFYRLKWDALLHALEGQRSIARVLGASEAHSFRQVIWPQIARQGFFLGGLASLWAWGDFALSAVVAERSVTAAMVVEGLMESYRLEPATSLVSLVIAGGFLNFAIFAGVGRVLGSKPVS